jgi:RNA polymerase sigma factor (sigma-70 family)
MQALIKGAQESAHNETLANLFKVHHKRLFHFISARVRNPADSEELAGQTFAEACKCFHSFRGDSELGTWLYGIAMNLIRQHITRSPQRRIDYVDDGDLEEFEDPTENPSVHLNTKQTINRLEQHLSALTPELRDALLMVTLDELSYEETAQRLSIPIGTVRSRVWRSRFLLKERLAAEGICVPA